MDGEALHTKGAEPKPKKAPASMDGSKQFGRSVSHHQPATSGFIAKRRQLFQQLSLAAASDGRTTRGGGLDSFDGEEREVGGVRATSYRKKKVRNHPILDVTPNQTC